MIPRAFSAIPALRFTSASLLLCAALCFAPSAQAPAAQPRRLLLWQGFNTEETAVFREILQEFERDWEARNSGADLEISAQYVSFGDMFTKLRTAAMARITPDIAFVDSIKVTDLAFGQALVRLDELPAFRERYGTLEAARSEFVSAAYNAAIVNRLGETGLYGLPVQTTCVALFWNRELFRNKAAELRAASLDPGRPPRDWEELFAYGRILTDPQRGVYGYGLANSLWFNFPFFNMYNVEFIEYAQDGTARPALNTPRGRACLDRILAIANSGVEGGAWKRSALSPDAGFLNRKYAMILTGPWNVESFTNAGLDFDIGLIPGPTREEISALSLEPADPALVEELGPQAWTSSNIGGQTGVILRSCQDRDLAFEFLDYFTSEDVQRRWASQLGQIPVRMAAWKDLDTSKYPYLPKFMTQLRTSRRVPQIPLYGILESDIFNPQMDLLLQNRQTPEEMMRKMDRELEERILGKINEAARRHPGASD